MDAGYDEGYKCCPFFWGTQPASLVSTAIDLSKSATRKTAIDLGCGVGKNAAALAQAGFSVVAIDKSEVAISHACRNYPELAIGWLACDLLCVTGPREWFDVVVATGSFHCLRSVNEISNAIERMKSLTKVGGLGVLSAFDDGPHDMAGHAAAFNPTLMPHGWYLDMFAGWKVLHASSVIQLDSHPHNEVPHSHSITRLLVRRIK